LCLTGILKIPLGKLSITTRCLSIYRRLVFERYSIWLPISNPKEILLHSFVCHCEPLLWSNLNCWNPKKAWGNRITVKIAEMFVNIPQCLSANGLDCFVPRNDRRRRSGSILNLTRCLSANSLGCFVPRNDRR